MSAITVGGDLVHYEVLGRGRPVVLVHGWIGSWRYWIPTMQQLHLKYRVYALDLFGYGDSGKNPEKYHIDYQVAMLDEFMKQLAIPKAAFIGHALGAMIVAEFARRFQEQKVPRLLLVSAPLFDVGDLDRRTPPGQQTPLTANYSPSASASPPAGSRPPSPAPPAGTLEPTIPTMTPAQRAAFMQQAAARELVTRANANDRKESAIISSPIMSGADPNNNYLRDSMNSGSLEALLAKCFKRSEPEYGKLEADVAKTDAAVLKNTVEGFAAGEMLDVAHQLQMPTVFIHGENDPLIPNPSEDVWHYLTLNKEDIHVPIPLPNVRHFPMLEHDRFGRLVGDFLETPDISNLEVKERWRRRAR